MIWRFFLAHFLADFPLQPNWMARGKTRLLVLALHAGIHWVTLMVLVGSIRWDLWPWLSLLALIHFGIDFGKLQLMKLRPDWIVGPYILDQVLHGLSIIGVVLAAEGAQGFQAALGNEKWAIYGIGFLWVTYVWAITEKVFSSQNSIYRAETGGYFWPRMALRSAIAGLWLFFLAIVAPSFHFMPLATISLTWLPYSTGTYRRQMLLTDLLVSLTGALFIFWA